MLNQEASTTSATNAPTEPNLPNSAAKSPVRRNLFAPLASVKLTVALMILIAGSVLVGAWCPQEAQVGQEKVIEQFGEQMATTLIQLGIADIFHSPWFLSLIGMLTVNMIACSFQRVFPKIRSLKLPMPWLGAPEISRLPFHTTLTARSTPAATLDALGSKLKRQGYSVRYSESGRMTAEFGKFGRLAATVTHIGLLTLLGGVTISSWTGFSGFKPVKLGEDLSFGDSEHSKLWIGKLPDWRVHVDATRRENYPTGEAKQWYSDLSVIDPQGKILSKQQISVNNPLGFGGVDVYQSSWGIDSVLISFNGHQRSLPLRPMGKIYAAFLPLDETTILIFSVRDQTKPLRLFAKRADWPGPRLLCELPPGGETSLGSVKLRFDQVVPLTGLQYKCDPGLPVVYTAFIFIICGVLLASVPHRNVWAAATAFEREQDGTLLTLLAVGGRSIKAKVGFERSMTKLTDSIINDHGADATQTVAGDTPQPAVEASRKSSYATGEKQLALAHPTKEVDQ